MTMPSLTQPQDLAGPWTISGADGDCRVELLASGPSPDAEPWEALMNDARLMGRACPGLEGTSRWQPIPLGFSLYGRDGRTLAVFEQTGPGRYRSVDGVWTATRP